MKTRQCLIIAGLGILIGVLLFHREKNTAGLTDAPELEEEGSKYQDSEIDEDLSSQIRRHFDSVNEPISFWGLVLDQDSNPLKGVAVTVQTRRATVDPLGVVGEDIDTFSLITDLSGGFTFEGKHGFSLSIVDIRKEGFEVASGSRRNFNVTGSDRGFESENPVVYYMIETQEKQNLVFSEFKLVSNWNGERILLSLRNGVVDELEMADLVVAADRDEGRGGQRAWDFTVMAPNGGVIAANEEAPAIAPLVGYSESWHIGYGSESTDYKSTARSTLFMKTKDEDYARIRITIYSDVVRPGIPSIIVRIAVNKSGGRILEELVQ